MAKTAEVTWVPPSIVLERHHLIIHSLVFLGQVLALAVEQILTQQLLMEVIIKETVHIHQKE